jgi:hypothetical protein
MSLSGGILGAGLGGRSNLAGLLFAFLAGYSRPVSMAKLGDVVPVVC